MFLSTLDVKILLCTVEKLIIFYRSDFIRVVYDRQRRPYALKEAALGLLVTSSVVPHDRFWSHLIGLWSDLNDFVASRWV